MWDWYCTNLVHCRVLTVLIGQSAECSKTSQAEWDTELSKLEKLRCALNQIVTEMGTEENFD